MVARAQQSTLPIIGFLNGGSPEGYETNLAGFLQGLKESGYIDGQNVKIEYRWAEGHYDRLPAMLADLVHRQVTVLAATSTPAALTAKAGTTGNDSFTPGGTDQAQLHRVAVGGDDEPNQPALRASGRSVPPPNGIQF